MFGVPHSLADERVLSQMPPKSYDRNCSPRSFSQRPDLERLGIEREDAAWTVTVGRAERVHGTPSGPQCTVCGAAYPVFSCTSAPSITLTSIGFRWIGLGVENVNARRAGARHDEVAAIDVRVRAVGTEARAARIPPEVVQLVVGVRELRLVDQLP